MKRTRKKLLLAAIVLTALCMTAVTALAAVGTGWNDDCRGNAQLVQQEIVYGKHNWVKQSESPGASFTSNGTATYSCSHCGATATRETSAPGHSWGSWSVTKAATCVSEGTETRKCNNCSATESRSIPATGSHSWGGWSVAKAATCAAEGTETRKCNNCSATESRSIPATGNHQWGEWKTTKQSSCTSQGTQTRTCSVCGKTESRSLPLTGHAYGAWTITTEPTCVSEGVQVHTCADCGRTETKPVPATGVHAYEWRTIQEAGCETDGIRKQVCAVCGAEGDEEDIPAIGHDWGEWQTIREASPELPGLEERVCKNNPEHVEHREIPYAAPVTAAPADIHPAIDLTLSWAENAGVGKLYLGAPIELTFHVTNTGDTPLYVRKDRFPEPYDHVAPNGWTTLSDYIPGAQVALLNPGEQLSFKAIYLVNENELQQQAKSGFVGEGGYYQDVTGAWSTVTDDEYYMIPLTGTDINPSIDLTLSWAADAGMGKRYLGAPVEITFLVTNTGDVPLHVDDTRYPDPFDIVVPYGWSSQPGLNYGNQQALLNPGEQMTYKVIYPVSEYDLYGGALNGMVGESGYYLDAEGEWQYVIDYEFMNVPLTGGQPNVSEKEPVLHLSVALIDSEPFSVDAFGYTDFIHYCLTAANVGEAPCDVSTIRRALPSETLSWDVGSNWLYPGDSVDFHMNYKFNESELEADGKLHIAFTVVGYTPDGAVESNTVSLAHDVLTELLPWQLPDDTTPTDMSLIKEVTSTPADLAGYQLGETVSYLITFTNHSQYTLNNVAINDDLYNLSIGVAFYTSVAPGESCTAVFDHTVTAEDVEKGFIYNIAFAVWEDPGSGNQLMVTSNAVTVGTADGAGSEQYGVYVGITFDAPPANGSYYVEGEQFPITVHWANTSGTTLYGASLYDSMAAWMNAAPLPSGYIFTDRILVPGDHGEFTYLYKVDDLDVLYGSVNDSAGIVAYDQTGLQEYAYYANCSAPAGEQGNIDYLPDPPPGKIDLSAIGQPDSCVTVLTNHGDGFSEYTLTPCADHGGVLKKADEVIAQAGDDRVALLAAWQQVKALWQEELDEMYQKLMAVADDNGKAILLNEQSNFASFLQGQEALLTAYYPDQPHKAAQEIADMLMRQVAELCYAYGNAPAQRPDSLITGTYGYLSARTGSEAVCVCAASRNEKGEVVYTLTLDADHARTENGIDTMLGNSRTRDQIVDVFNRAQRAYQADMDQIVNTLYRAADQETRKMIAQARTAFDAFRKYRRATLTMLYPDNPEIVSEVLAQLTKQYAVFICQQFSAAIKP